MKNKFLKYSEIFLFYSGVGFNVWILCHFTFLGGRDAYAHLYYARVINYLLSGNSFMNQYFTLNHLPVPNLTDHYLLALFNLLFHPVFSQKLLLAIYFIGFPVCFRVIIKKYNPGGIAASTFIIPFTQCRLFYCGEYNFCISFTFLFCAMFYYVKNFSDAKKLYSPVKYFIFLMLVLLNYFTNGLSFLFLALICGLAELYWFFSQRDTFGKIKANSLRLSYVLKRTFLFCMLWIPGFTMFIIFNHYTSNLQYNNLFQLPFKTLSEWFYDFICFGLYDYAEDNYTQHLFFYWLVLTLGLTVFLRLKNKPGWKFLLTDIFFVLFIITLIAYYVVPVNALVGIMTERLFYYVMIFLFLWIALQESIRKIAMPLAAIFLIMSVIYFFNKYYPSLTALNNDALDVQKAAAFIPPGNVVGPVYLIPKLEEKISDILGMDKPLVILDGYEPELAGRFAVNMKIGNGELFYIKMNEGYFEWLKSSDSTAIRPMDYLLLQDDLNGANIQNRILLNNLLKGYTLIYSTDDNRFHVLKLKKDVHIPPFGVKITIK